jgi:DNA-binding transcriptional ArsR family regulator
MLEHMNTRSYIQLRDRPLADGSAAALAETFKVLGDVTRVRILDALARDEVPVCDLAEMLGLTQSAVSHQLRLLRQARLVRSRRDGQHIYYTLDDHHIVRLFEQGLEHVEERTERTVASSDRAEQTSEARQVRGGGAPRTK